MANDQQFCLRWNNHQSTLISVFDSLLENGTLVDCTLAAEGQYLKAHKVVLSACSPYLETLLSQHYEKHPIVILKDVKFSELKSMMDYMYRGEVNISQDQLGTFLKAAESLQIKGLSDNGDEAVGTSSAAPKKDAPRPSVTQTARPIESKRPAPPGDTSDASRDGSISPSSLRKRRRTRRPSQGEENHLDSNVCDTAQSTPIVPAVTVPAPVKQIVKQEPNLSINETGLKKEIIDPPTEPLLEPKTEYLDYMNNENSIEVEDLTLDDDDDLDSSMDNSRPGPSHGDMSNQGYPAWPMGDQSGTDEIFMAAQEAVGAATGQQQRDSQDVSEKPEAEKSDDQSAKDDPVPVLQVINVDTNKPLKIMKIDTSMYKKKQATKNKESSEKSEDPLKWLHSQFIEVEVCSSETLNRDTEQAVAEPQSQEEDDDDHDPAAESNDSTSDDDSDEEKKESKEEDDSNLILGLKPKRQRGTCENVQDDMEYDEEQQKYKCKRCDKMFKVKTSVVNHLRNICTTDPRYACEYCPYKARSGVSLRVHYGRYHSTPATRIRSNIIQCSRSKNKTLENEIKPTNLLSPKKSKAKESPKRKSGRKQKEKKAEESGELAEKEFEYDEDTKLYTCKTCEKTFKTEHSVGVHTGVLCGAHVNKSYKCYFCPYTGRNAALVRVHMGKKHGKWPKLDENGVWIY